MLFSAVPVPAHSVSAIWKTIPAWPSRDQNPASRLDADGELDYPPVFVAMETNEVKKKRYPLLWLHQLIHDMFAGWFSGLISLAGAGLL